MGGVVLVVMPATVTGQTLAERLRNVTPSVVVIRARGRDMSRAGQERFTETGSGVLSSAEGKVMTASRTANAGGSTRGRGARRSSPGASVATGCTRCRCAWPTATRIGG
jgi:hypothetical protein